MPTSPSASRVVERKRPAGRWPLVLLGVLLGAAVLLTAAMFVLPPSMITRFLPALVHAEDYSGTLMHGAAGKIAINGRDMGAVEWRLHPLSLLRLAVVAEVHWVKVGFVIDGTTEITSRGVAAHDVRGGGPLESLREIGVAPGWQGTANVTFTELRSDFAKLTAAVGRVEVADIANADIAAGTNLGGYLLQMTAGAVAADGSISATLNDTGGPVEVQAQIRLSPGVRTGMLSGTLRERPEASPALRTQLADMAQLHPRDASGRFPVELEFTY